MGNAIQNKELKEYNYLSRYASIPTYYNSGDRKRYYGTALQLSRKLTAYRTHIVQRGESLDTISLKYYGQPLYWWIVADINSIQDPLTIKMGQKLIIPDINEVVFTESIR